MRTLESCFIWQGWMSDREKGEREREKKRIVPHYEGVGVVELALVQQRASEKLSEKKRSHSASMKGVGAVDISKTFPGRGKLPRRLDMADSEAKIVGLEEAHKNLLKIFCFPEVSLGFSTSLCWPEPLPR